MKLSEKKLRKEWDRTRDLIARYYPEARNVEYRRPEIRDEKGAETSEYDAWRDRVTLRRKKKKDRAGTLTVTRAFITRLLHLSADVSYLLAAHNPEIKKYWLGLTVLRRLWAAVTGASYTQYRIPGPGGDVVKDFKK